MPTPSAELTAKLVEWDRQKGYGFLQAGPQRVFLHRREFAELPRTPVVGEKIRFTMGLDAQGRSCAKNARFVRSSVSLGVGSLLALIGLLVLPTLAAWDRGWDYRWIGGYAVLVSAFTCWNYARDKRLAREGAWRVAEARLHLLELLGGWPGAFLAQRRLRHKCSKGSYQFVFWLIVLGYQFAALDSFQDWQLSRAGLEWIELASGRRR